VFSSLTLAILKVELLNSSKKMREDQSFSNVLVVMLVGAAFAAGAIGFQPWRHQDSASVEVERTAQRDSYDAAPISE
jgi:hypothetical protein